MEGSADTALPTSSPGSGARWLAARTGIEAPDDGFGDGAGSRAGTGSRIVLTTDT